MTRQPDELVGLKAALADNAESLLVELFGDPTKRGAREWRWGRKGSVAYRFDRSVFWNFESDQGGSLLDAIMFAEGCTFASAITWAKQWLDTDDAKPRPRLAKPRQRFDADAEQQRAALEASALCRAGRRINSTAAEKYLRGPRAIDRWSDDSVRFISARDVARIAWPWWRWPAIMFPLTDSAGNVRAVQLVALTDQGEAVPHWEDGRRKLKITRGPMAGAAVRFPGDPTGPLALAEGAEDALSVWLSTGHETWAIMGSIGRAPLDAVPASRTIIVARDDDPPRSPARKALRDRLAGWRRQGRHVVVAQPWKLSRGDKSDFNDTLKAGGPEAVRERIDAALRPQATTQGIARRDALLQLATAVGRTVSDLLAWQPDGEAAAPFKVASSTLGLGKSEAALGAVIPAIWQGHRVVYSVPTHELAAEMAARARALAEKRGKPITVRVWHGREREDPAAPGQNMCRDLVAAKLAQQAGIDVLKTVCDAPCQFRASCAYLAQRQAPADLWIVPHALLFAALPATMKGAAMLIIDEGLTLAGMIGVDGAPLLVPFKSLDDHVTHGSGDAALSADLDATLRPHRQRLLGALADHPASDHGEPLQRAALVAAGLTVDMATEARKAEGRRRRDVSKIDSATRADLLRELRLIRATNVSARRAAMLWDNLSALLADDGAGASGRVELVETDDGERAFRLYGLDKMGKGWRALPTLHLDATADMDLLRLRIPNAELVANVEAAEPHVQVHQVVGRAFGKVSLEHGKAADDARRFALAQAAEDGGRWLIVASKAAAEAWRPTLPENIGVAHFGDVRGLDAFKDVRGIVVVGRWGVRPGDVERMAAVLTGRAVPHLDGWFPTEAVTLTAADGSSRTVDADRHPDATAEAVRRALVEAELLQAIGRGRGVQRGAGDPLDVFVLGNVALPLPLATLADWEPVDPDRAMLADHGVWLQSAGDTGHVVGKATNAVKAARQRMGTCPYKNLLYGRVPNLDPARSGWRRANRRQTPTGSTAPSQSRTEDVAVKGDLPAGLAVATYQRAGAGRSETRMVYSPDRIADPEAWLVARFGPLAHFEADDQPRRNVVEEHFGAVVAITSPLAGSGGLLGWVSSPTTTPRRWAPRVDLGAGGQLDVRQRASAAPEVAAVVENYRAGPLHAGDQLAEGREARAKPEANSGSLDVVVLDDLEPALPARPFDDPQVHEPEEGADAGGLGRYGDIVLWDNRCVPVELAEHHLGGDRHGPCPAALHGAADCVTVEVTRHHLGGDLRTKGLSAGATSTATTSTVASQRAPASNPADLAAYAGGIMSPTVQAAIRSACRAGGLTQQQLADRAAISRPQLANSLQGRFGLSAEAAARLRAVVVTLPVVQPALL